MKENLRTAEWMQSQELTINRSVGKLLRTWSLEKPISQMTWLEKKQAEFIVEVLMSAYGLNMKPEIFSGIVHGFYPNLSDGLKQGMTDNHSSLAVQLIDGIATPVKYSPVLLNSTQEIGTISPLNVISKTEGKYELQFQNGFTQWKLDIKIQKPADHAITNFTFKEEEFLGKLFADTCVSSNKGGYILVDSNHVCEQGCKFCTYPQGNLLINQENFAKLEHVLTFIAQKTGKITACLSGGSSLTADRGILEIFTPMLEIVDKLKNFEPSLLVELELELMPWQTTKDTEILSLIRKYYNKGFVKAINLNLETVDGIDRNEFMSAGEFGKATIPINGTINNNRGYLETFDLLKKEFSDIQLAGLILYGLKPKDMDWADYSRLCLETINLFGQHQVKLLLQPIKISSKTEMAGYPLIDPYWLAGSILMAGTLHQKYGLDTKHRVGCVNGCDACDASRSSYSLLNSLKNTQPALLQGIISPWINELEMFDKGEQI